jgi:hypothetical protein
VEKKNLGQGQRLFLIVEIRVRDNTWPFIRYYNDQYSNYNNGDSNIFIKKKKKGKRIF